MSEIPRSTASTHDSFASVIAPLLFDGTRAERSPSLHIVLSGSVHGRSRATSRVRGPRVVLNARDLEVVADGLSGGAVDVRQTAAGWLQRALTEARERRVSVVLEGAFGSSDLISGISRLFEASGYETRLWAVAERSSEVRMADASRSFDIQLRQRSVVLGPLARADVDVAATLSDVVAAGAVGRVTVLSRGGDVVADVPRADPGYSAAGNAMREAASQPLGTLRSTLWLAELRRMTRLLSERQPAPAWAYEELVALHEAALADIVPGLPIEANSETRSVQETRLRAALTVLRESATNAARDSATPEVRRSATAEPVVSPHRETPGLSR